MSQPTVDRELVRRVEHDFTLHPPESDEVAEVMDTIREAYKTLAVQMARMLPSGRDQALCITELENSLMRAIAAVARNQGRWTAGEG
jgi:hypothetical protein